MSRRLVTVVVLVVVLAFVVVAVAPAFAATPSGLVQHSRLLKATPATGRASTPPEEVVLAFNEEVDEQFVKVTVEGPDGAEVDGDPRGRRARGHARRWRLTCPPGSTPSPTAS